MSTTGELSIKEAAALTGFTETFFRRICKKGKGPNCRRDGRTMFFLPATLESWKANLHETLYSESSAGSSAPKKAGGRKKAA